MDNPEKALVNLRKEGDSSTVRSVENTVPGVVVMQVPYRPGWQLKIDGQAAQVQRVNRGLLGVLLEEPGRHELELRYWPSFWNISFLIFPLGFAGLWLVPRSRLGRAREVTGDSHIAVEGE